MLLACRETFFYMVYIVWVKRYNTYFEKLNQKAESQMCNLASLINNREMHILNLYVLGV